MVLSNSALMPLLGEHCLIWSEFQARCALSLKVAETVSYRIELQFNLLSELLCLDEDAELPPVSRLHAPDALRSGFIVWLGKEFKT